MILFVRFRFIQILSSRTDRQAYLPTAGRSVIVLTTHFKIFNWQPNHMRSNTFIFSIFRFLIVNYLTNFDFCVTSKPQFSFLWKLIFLSQLLLSLYVSFSCSPFWTSFKTPNCLKLFNYWPLSCGCVSNLNLSSRDNFFANFDLSSYTSFTVKQILLQVFSRVFRH